MDKEKIVLESATIIKKENQIKNLFKPKPIIEPTKEALEKSIRNNLTSANIYSFVAFGLGCIYLIYYVKTGILENELLIGMGITIAFYLSHIVIHKIDKVRLELLNATKEE